MKYSHVTSTWHSALAGLVVVSGLVLGTGCGKLESFGIAPGVQPPPDAVVPPDPPIPTDSGECVDGGLPYPSVDSAEFFNAYVLPGVQGCAFCHFGATAPVMDSVTAHDVMQQRIQLDAIGASATIAGQLFQLDGADAFPNHDYRFPPESRANAQLWIENHIFGPCTGNGPINPVLDAGQPDVPTPVDAGCEATGELSPNTVAQLAVQMSDELFEAFRSAEYCTNCHVAPQAQGGFQYIAANKASLTQSLIATGRIEAGRSAADTTLGRYLNLGAPANPVEGATGIHVVASENAGFSTALRTDTTNLLENIAYQLALVSCDPPDLPDVPPPPDVDIPRDVEPPVDVDIVDGGIVDVVIVDVPPPDVVVEDAGCSPLPYGNAESFAYFNANLLDATRSCANCHFQFGINPTMNDSTAHNVLKQRIEFGATSATETTAGKYLRVDGATSPGHAHPFTASAQAKIWITNHLDGVLPAGCQ